MVARSLRLLFRLTLRDLRGGLGGFGVFLACIALGVAGIVGVGSVSRSLSDGLLREGRVILGGDLAFGLIHRQIAAEERTFLESNGRLSSVALLRAMARTAEGEPSLVEVKAVDGLYPAAGGLRIAPDMPLADALAPSDDAFGALADAELAARFNLNIGDRLRLGDITLILRGVIVNEPDRLAGGLAFGPRVLITQSALQRTGLIQPGSLIRWLYRLDLEAAGGGPIDEARISGLTRTAEALFPEAGWEVRTRLNVSPQMGKSIDQFALFLTLIGLTALMVGGIGIGNAVTAFIDAKQATIAILKSLGGGGGFVFSLMLAETLIIASLGIAAGLAIGAALPFLISGAFGARIPIPFVPGVFPQEIAAGALYGVLTTLTFALLPLGAIQDVLPATLFRGQIQAAAVNSRLIYRAAAALAAAGLASAILLLARDARLAGYFLVAAIVALALLRIIAALLVEIVRRAPNPSSAVWRLALANIHRPGAPTRSVVQSLGLGVALLVALAAIDGNLRRELDRSGQGDGNVPSFFFADIQSAQAEEFTAFLKGRTGAARIDEVPMMRGRLVQLKGVPVDRVKAKESVAWVLEGDRGLTFAPTAPEGSRLTEGSWWPGDYTGFPLVSVEAEIAAGLGLSVGDTVTVNVLGRNLVATIANLRTVNWRSFGINFVFIFSPNAFAGAPHTRLATVTYRDAGDLGRELALLRDVAGAYPTITGVRVKDTLAAIGKLLGQLSFAIRGASSIALASAVLVLGGALASGRRARLYDAVVLKVLGMTRTRLTYAYVIEFAVLGLAAAFFGVFAGMAAAWAVTTLLLKLEFVWLWPESLAALAGAAIVTLVIGIGASWRLLGLEPASALRFVSRQ